MLEDILFYTVLLSQVLLLSWYYPNRILGRMSHVQETHPPAEYPKLYPRPVEYYPKAQRNYRIMNQIIMAAGVILVATLCFIPRSGEWDHVIVTWFFFFQFVPVALLDMRSLREFKLMRIANTSGTRKADLQPRRLSDFISPMMMGATVAAYLGFIALVIFVKRFDFPWFGGYWNIVGVTVMNLFLAGIVLWHMYGKKLDPHQAHEDRLRQITTVVNMMALVSIAATVFIAISIVLAALDLRHLQRIAQCVYFQLLAVICLQAYLLKGSNFEVYKENPAAA